MSDIPTISEEQIAALARHFWEDEGKPEGKSDEHWLRAEAELRRRLIEEIAVKAGTALAPLVVGVS